MGLDTESHTAAFERSGSRCMHCGKQLSRSNHGRGSGRGAYETDHRMPRARGGTDHGRNLIAICAECNILKSDMPASKFNELMAEQRQARQERCLNYNIRQAALPAIVAGGLSFLAMGIAQAGPPESQQPSSEEDRKRRLARLIFLPMLIGVGILAVIVLCKMSRR